MKSLLISMLLKNLIRDISKNKKNIVISGLSTNSRKIKKNYIFFAIKGKKFNGEKFIKDAVNDATDKADKAAQKKMKKVTGGIKIPGLF